jgi:hypothetical protein
MSFAHNARPLHFPLAGYETPFRRSLVCRVFWGSVVSSAEARPDVSNVRGKSRKCVLNEGSFRHRYSASLHLRRLEAENTSGRSRWQL